MARAVAGASARSAGPERRPTPGPSTSPSSSSSSGAPAANTGWSPSECRAGRRGSRVARSPTAARRPSARRGFTPRTSRTLDARTRPRERSPVPEHSKRPTSPAGSGEDPPKPALRRQPCGWPSTAHRYKFPPTYPKDDSLADEAALRDALRGRYVVERELGRGGMATVYLARDVKHKRLV